MDPGLATMVVFPDTMYTFRDTQGGVKIENFFLYQHPVDPNVAWADPEGGGGARGPNPPGKTQVIWDSIGKK